MPVKRRLIKTYVGDDLGLSVTMLFGRDNLEDNVRLVIEGHRIVSIHAGGRSLSSEVSELSAILPPDDKFHFLWKWLSDRYARLERQGHP